MPSLNAYSPDFPSREQLNSLPGLTLVEFGRNDCQHCQALAPLLFQLLGQYPQLRHLRLEDGKGRLLGRRLGVSLWPTLIFLRDGQEVAREVRPGLAQLESVFKTLFSA